MLNRQFAVYRAVLVALFATPLVALTACSNDSDVKVTGGNLSARLVMPAPVLSGRALENPAPKVLLNGNRVPTNQEGDALQWTASIAVAQNQQHQLAVSWEENGLLAFAQAVECFSTADGSPIALNFSSDDYDTSQDSDGDGRSNLDELNNNTNPRDVNDPPQRLAKSVLTLSLELPEILKVIPDATLNSFEVKLVVNGLPVANLAPNDNNDALIGQANVSVASRAFVIVDWHYRLANDSVRVARLAQPQQISDDGDTFYLAGKSADYRTDYDRDSDGRSNLDEIVSGSDAVSGVASVCIR